ncbi:MAG: SET domain-containing protein-lysine N-methyltransferase [Saprospiraceae bacterium]|nr:SET domain-containing protein-lysine N-methyltransferase [Saprospiraceae bacterium]
MEKIEAPESAYLYIALSQIPSAGQGLYTLIDIYKEEIIAKYKGRILTSDQINSRVERGRDQYFINLPNGCIMDSMNHKCFAKYANDATGKSDSSFKNNAKITLDDEDHICLLALRNIKSGEEIFCNYGSSYWKKHGK